MVRSVLTQNSRSGGLSGPRGGSKFQNERRSIKERWKGRKHQKTVSAKGMR